MNDSEWDIVRKKPNIYVIDRLPGCDKTSHIIDMLKNVPYQYVIATPLRSEIQRYKEYLECSTPYSNGTLLKVDTCLSMLHNLQNVVTTHTTLKAISHHFIPMYGSKLIIDETIDVFEHIQLSKGIIESLLETSLRVSNNMGLLEWCGDIHKFDITGKDEDIYKIYRACEHNQAYLLHNTIVITQMSIDILQSFNEVYILTYGFKDSLFATWLDIHNMSYMYSDVSLEKDNTAIIATLRDNITIVAPEELELLQYTWSYSDWEKNIDIDAVRSALRDIMIKYGYDASKTLVTCPKKVWVNKKREDTIVSSLLYDAQWLSVLTRATNDYGDYDTVLYLYNKNYDAAIISHLNKYNKSVDNDAYALSELLQFIFRSAIRNGNPITLVLPSIRMRHLLKQFLGLEPEQEYKYRSAKLTHSQRSELRQLASEGMKKPALAKKYGISRKQVYRILKEGD